LNPNITTMISKRYDITNSLIERYKYKRYLEIGCNKRHRCFDKVKADYKTCVDPNPKAEADYCMTSDEFFQKDKNSFDIIFVDGLHTDEQSYKDIINSLDRIGKNGHIIVHDCNPLEEAHQTLEKTTKTWNGPVWKAWCRLRCERDDLSMAVIDIDEGCGVIKYGSQKKLDLRVAEFNWGNFDKKRREWLNLISPEEFEKKWL
jgi:hypothetical protein